MSDPERNDVRQESPINTYEKIGRFTVGALEGGLGGAIGAVLAWKVLGIHFDAPVEQVLITVPAIVGGLDGLRDK